jgi:hypothetical protein
MADATYSRGFDESLVRSANAVSAGELVQMPDGRAGFYDPPGGALAPATGTAVDVRFKTQHSAVLTKATGVVILKGGRVYWDHSANNCTYKKVNDRDFYVGRAAKDAASGDAVVEVLMNVDPRYDIDMGLDPFATTIVGTQALGGLALLRRGGAHHIVLNATNEAQKVDMLSVDAFAVASNPIVEFAFRVISDGAGTVVDVSLGAANATHATDADSITESVFIHLDANNVNINAESDDGTTEVAATDTTINYTEGSSVSERVEVWMDFRDPADVQIYVNGALVLDGTTFNINVATGPLKLLAHIEKTASTDTYELALDWMRARYAEN